jgi:hypothetical protein
MKGESQKNVRLVVGTQDVECEKNYKVPEELHI